MMALFFALEMITKSDISAVYTYKDRNRSLLEVAADPKLPRDSLIIFEDTLDRNVLKLHDLPSSYEHPTFINELKSRNAYFVFTVSDTIAEDNAEVMRRFPTATTESIDIFEVYQKHIDYYYPKNLMSEDQRKVLAAGKLSDRRQVSALDELFERFRGNPEEIIKALAGGRPPRESAYVWFDRLRMNQKLYALLVVLFENLDAFHIDEIYHASVNELRRQGMDGPLQFIDPRRIGTRDMYSLIHVNLRGSVVEFVDSTYREEVTRQIENYHRLLWTLADITDENAIFRGFVGVIKHMGQRYRALTQTDVDSDQHAVLQRRWSSLRDQRIDELQRWCEIIASALARIGVYHREPLGDVLRKLALDDDVFVVLTAPQIFAQIARIGDYSFILDTVGDWARSGNFDLMWAAVASIAYVYESIARDFDRGRTVGDTNAAEAEDTTERAQQQAQKHRITLRETTFMQLRELLAELAQNHDKFDRDLIKAQVDHYQRQLWDGYRRERDKEIERQIGQSLKELNPTDREELRAASDAAVRIEIEAASETFRALLTTSWCNQMRLAIVRAIELIARIRPKDVAGLLEDWLNREDREDFLWQIGRMSLNGLFKATADIKALLLEKQAYPLLTLLPVAMRSNRVTMAGLRQRLSLYLSSEDMTEAGIIEEHIKVDWLLNANPVVGVVDAMHNWYKSAIRSPDQVSSDDDENSEENESEPTLTPELSAAARASKWEQEVYPRLLAAVNEATRDSRQELRTALLQKWVGSEHSVVARMAHAIIVRSHVMDGLVLDLPVNKRCSIVAIDGSYRGKEAHQRYFAPLYHFVEKMSALVPIEVHLLGYTNRVYRLGGARSDETFHVNDLEIYGHQRSNLIMPLLAPRAQVPYTPQQCHFITVFNTQPLIDLEDLLGELNQVVQSSEQHKGNIFAQRSLQRETAAVGGSWPWRGKLFLMPSAEKPLPDTLVKYVHIIRSADLTVLETQVCRRIARTLHTVPLAELWADLETHVPIRQPRTAETIQADIEGWLAELNNINRTHPHDDVSLTVSWVILLLSRENPQMAVELVEMMLDDSSETADSDNLLRTSKRQMGVACVRMLFNFYNADNADLSVQRHEVLLRLLPAFGRVAQHYSELLPIIDTLLTWAQRPEWLIRLDDDGSELIESLYHIQDIRPFLAWMERYQKLSQFFKLFMRIAKPVDEFVALGQQIQSWRDQATSGRRRRARILPPALAEDVLQEFRTIVPKQGDDESAEVYQWLIDKAEIQQDQLLDPAADTAVIDGLGRAEVLIQRIQTELQTRLLGKLPVLGQGSLYGVIFVDTTRKEPVRQALRFIREFVGQKQAGRGDHIILTLHRLGSKELVTSVRRKVRIKERDILNQRHHFVPLIGATLERYPTVAEIAFVVIISANRVLDFEDWADQRQWADRLWVASLGKWKPVRGEVIVLEENTPATVDKILKRTPPRS